ncbi:hypothetical protein BE21_02465 [Sorangium cellulosum]|uniref:Helix-turn-helix domain-containing protein n=1 Tax=Sorangium cellulosum TaxID=56 RepID=A0A150TS61_SORCE|nr:hypothetical protein BE21_02465 [Sorangium cellulosum]
MRAEALLRAIRIVLDEAEPATRAANDGQPQAATWLPIGKFARTYSYSTKSVSRWVRLGMPSVGKGRNCRIHVEGAVAWLGEGGPAKALKKRGADAHARALQ